MNRGKISLHFLLLFALLIYSNHGYKLNYGQQDLDNLEDQDPVLEQDLDISPSEILYRLDPVFRSIWDSQLYGDRAKRVHGALRFHRPGKKRHLDSSSKVQLF